MEETDKIRALLRTELRTINNDNPTVIRQEIINDWEAMTGKRLYPAQSDNFILNEIAAREANTKTQLNEAILQQYTRTATGLFLEELGYPWGISRQKDIRIDEEGKEYLYEEDDDRLRRRILLAPEAITNAGTVGAYTFHALNSDLAILDVDVSTPDDGAGNVHITVYGDGSKPIEDLCNSVYHAITHEKVCVLCVTYTVSAPIDVHYSINAEVTIYKNYAGQAVKSDVIKAIQSYVDNPRKHYSIDNVNNITELEDRYKRLGVDIVGSQIIDAVHSVTGVYHVKLLGFPESDVVQVMSGDDYPFGALEKVAEIGICDGITVTVVGIANE